MSTLYEKVGRRYLPWGYLSDYRTALKNGAWLVVANGNATSYKLLEPGDKPAVCAVIARLKDDIIAAIARQSRNASLNTGSGPQELTVEQQQAFDNLKAALDTQASLILNYPSMSDVVSRAIDEVCSNLWRSDDAAI